MLNDTGRLSERWDAWVSRFSPEFEEFVDGLIAPTPGLEAENRLVGTTTHCMNLAQDIAICDRLCADRDQLRICEESRLLCVTSYDESVFHGEKSALLAGITDCNKRLKDGSLPHAILKDIAWNGYERIYAAARRRRIVIDIIERDPDHVKIVLNSMRVIFDFSRRTWWDWLTWGWVRSPCMVECITARVQVDDAFYHGLGTKYK
jgi:hypothetical protein